MRLIFHRLPPVYGLYAFFAGCLLLQLGLIAVPRADHHLLGSDGLYYFAYLRSAVLEGNLNISNEIAFYNSTLPADAEVDIQMRDLPHLTYAYAIGSSILWLPFFLLGHGLVRLLNLEGLDLPLHGYTYWEEASVCLGSLIYGCLGLWLVYRFLSQFFSQPLALGATLATCLGTSSFYYLIFEPSMSHANSFFACTVFFYLFVRYALQQQSSFSFPQAILLGLAAGLMVLVRWQNLVFLGVFLVPLFKTPIQTLKLLLPTLAVAAVSFVPQILFWKINLGHWLTIPQGQSFMTPLQPQLGAVLFTLQHGLISWTPLVALCLWGLVYWLRRENLIASALLLAFGLMWYVNASVTADIGGGAAFGMRRFDGCTLIFAVGLAALWEHSQTSPWHNRLFKTALAGLLIWNTLFMVQYRLHFIDPIETISWHELIWGKFEMLGEIPQKILSRFN